MKTKLLLAHSLFAFFISTVSPSNAQYIYIDIVPDTTISDPDGYYNLDLNNDGIMDFQISLFIMNDFNSIDIKTLNDNSYISYYDMDGGVFTRAYSFNDSIGDFCSWSNGSEWGINIANHGGTTTSMHYGEFIGEVDKCLGLKIIASGEIFYGWVRIDVASDASWFKMKDYASNDTTIVAGQMSSSLSEAMNTSNDFALYYNNNEVVLENTNNSEIINVRLFNQAAQLIMNYGVVKENIRINTSNFKYGLYFLVIDTKNQTKTLKILIN